MDVQVRGDDVPPAWLDVVRNAVAFALQAEEAPTDVEVGVVFIGEAAMREMNRRFRGIDAPTDVLTFPYEDIDERVPAGRERVLGDVAMCASIAQRNAEEVGQSVEEELRLLGVHGALHLVGYDHLDDASAARMEQREREILTALRHRLGAAL